jgi:Bacterial protein of unknown function (DUF937)/PRC-barrel domain
MRSNLVSAVLEFLTPTVVERLGASTGLETDMAGKAATAVVPSLLSGLAVLAAKPVGALQLETAIAEQPIDTLQIFSRNIPGSALQAAMGTGVLYSLLGGSALGMLTSAVSRFAGSREGSVRTLAGILTPLILSVLGRAQRAAGLDAHGLARMLASQTDQIAGAMPSHLRNLLDASGLYECIGSSTAPQIRAAWRTTDSRSRPTSMQRAIADPTTRVHSATWLYGVLSLLVVGGLLWNLFPDRPRTTEPATTSAKLTYFTAVPDNWTSIGGTLNNYVGREIYNRAGENLGTVGDILVGPDGKMAAALINVGRFLGIGQKDVAVSFAVLQMEHGATKPRIVIDATKEELQSAPTFLQPPPRPKAPKR